ncbi:Uncharacterised protein [Vibrio cholerae]|nr:Uncharacterised protein [Vibrio cholerae]
MLGMASSNSVNQRSCSVDNLATCSELRNLPRKRLSDKVRISPILNKAHNMIKAYIRTFCLS